MLDYSAIRARAFPDIVQRYAAHETILYALGLGYGVDPLDEDELRFVIEPELKAVPTQVAVLGTPGFFWQDPALGVDWVRIVHGEQDIRWFGTLPSAATVMARNRVAALTDKGPGKGAVAQIVRDLFEEESGKKIAEVRQVVFLRGNGGYSSYNGKSDPPPTPLPQIDDVFGPPDCIVEFATLRQAALIYRLSGDFNPLHADPATARTAGFDRPILHGLCSYGMAARALLGAYLDHDPSRLRRLAVRFTAPVFPGETLAFEFWRRGDSEIAIRARVPARDVTVLNHGIAEIAPAA